MDTLVKEKLNLKCSNVDWCGNIPKDWRVEKIKAHFKLSKERASADGNDILSLTQKGIKIRDISGNEGQMAASYDNYAKLRKGDIVLNPMDLISGYVDLASQEGIISPAYTILRKKKTELNLEYAKHYFQWHYIFNIFFPFGKGVSVDHRWTLANDVLLNLPILIPPVKTQEKIADFLDEKTKKIDQAIDKKQKLIKTLREERISIITKAVTRGIDQNAKMKNSGIDWLGKIPADWEIKKLKFCFELVVNKIFENQTNNTILLENIESWTGKFLETNINYDGQGVKFIKGDILFGKLRPYLAKVLYAQEEGEVLGDILVYRPSKFIFSKFGFYSFISYRHIDIVNSHTYGVKMPRANPSIIGGLPFIYPNNLETQKQIVNFLDDKTVKIDKSINGIQKQIEKLKEYRSSLIYNAVTGKIKI